MASLWFAVSNATLQRYSVSQEWAEMLSEWIFTGEVKEIESGECELCTHQGLSWHFKILNVLNGNELHVGSECIKLFYAEYNLNNPDLPQVDLEALNSELDELVREYVEDNRISSLRSLLRSIRITNPDFPINVKNGKFSPKQLIWMLSLAKKCNIQYDPIEIKVNLKKLKFFRQISYGSDARLSDLINYIEFVLPSMNTQQIKSLEKLSKKRELLLNRAHRVLFQTRLQ